MDLSSLNWKKKDSKVDPQLLLESYYERLLRWSMLLTRGDVGKAEEIVQEFCLYLTLTRPELGAVKNLDGYLYTCLRNLYQSSLARSSREAMQFISTTDFDTLRFAFASNGGDSLERQNELRRVCSYAVWRKEQTKSFSYLILHFFHGYHRREVGEMAGVPIAAIYNKLKTARAEVKSHLEDAGKLRIVGKEPPPPHNLSWKLVSSPDLFRELRNTIIDAKTGPCLPEEDLLAYYQPAARPLPCLLLAHLVSCERCLAIIDRWAGRPTLSSRESLDGIGPLEGSASRSGISGSSLTSRGVLNAVRERWNSIYEHRPNTLSIAVNGKIIALHHVEGAHNTLAARIDQTESVRFIEVFSEQNVRFALLPIEGAPPDGPHTLMQRVELSDERWLELRVTFDGQGLCGEASYFDPVLAAEAGSYISDQEDEGNPINACVACDFPQESTASLLQKSVSFFRGLFRGAGVLIPASVSSWAFALVIILGMVGYLSYYFASARQNAGEILRESAKLEAAALKGKTEHQSVQIEQMGSRGRVVQRAIVELWRDGNGQRYIRHLYDAQHHMVATEWRSGNGNHLAYLPNEKKTFAALPWTIDLSVRAFGKLTNGNVKLQRRGDGYTVTAIGPTADRPRLVFATLILNRSLHPLRETLRFHGDAGDYDVRFVQTVYEAVPSRSVPASIFEPGREFTDTADGQDDQSSVTQQEHGSRGKSLRLLELQIAVLYRLNQMGVDANEPITVSPTTDGHIRVLGSISTVAQQSALIAQLEALPDHQLLEIHLGPQRNLSHLRSLQFLHAGTETYVTGATEPPAYPLVRQYFSQKGLSGPQLDAAAISFSGDMLQLSQRALQNAYALERLGSILAGRQSSEIDATARGEWTEMVTSHASSLDDQIRMLNSKLRDMVPEAVRSRQLAAAQSAIVDTSSFARASLSLLVQMRAVDRDLGVAFAAGSTQRQTNNIKALLTSTTALLPIAKTEQVAEMSRRLSITEKVRAVDTGQRSSLQKGPGQSR